MKQLMFVLKKTDKKLIPTDNDGLFKSLLDEYLIKFDFACRSTC
jgi:hypothetical protein